MDDSISDAPNEHENAAYYEGYRNTSVNEGEQTMSDQNGVVWRDAGNQRHRTSNMQDKWKRRARDKRPGPPSERALGGRVPAVPIFIPADQIRRQERFRRDSKPKKEATPCDTTAVVPLSAELLTRRWVRGKAS